MKNRKQPKKTNRNYSDLLDADDELDRIFAIDRNAVIESGEEDPSCPVFKTYGELVEFYQRLVGRRIAVREFLADKNVDQAVEEELRHLRNVIGSFIDRTPETINSEERFDQLVPFQEQTKVWKAMFADFPGRLPFDLHFNLPLYIFLLLLIFSNALWLLLQFPLWQLATAIFLGIGIVFILVLVVLSKLYYFRTRRSTLRTIAEKAVEAKKQFADYPISSIDDVEPMIRRTFQETFHVPSDLLKPETRLDRELEFEL
ncbi:MAG: hypothetical protein LBT09_07775 [Planctomycetaceae bacterium]|jgi:hypothetical protein|nr:hypothetical protein [Planctomycetaceae bacterium]